MIYLRYLVYVVRHKWFVMVECWRRGLIWQGITHDLSKFLPSEFFHYAKYFYDVKNMKVHESFSTAWFYHQRRNKHHWQYWVYPCDIQSPGSERVSIIPMPSKYVTEMVCDWLGASRAQGNKDPNRSKKWWEENQVKMILHPKTIARIKYALL